MSGVVTVTGKTVEFPNDNQIKVVLCAVFDHALKIRTAVCFGGKGTVNVLTDNRNSVLLCKSITLPHLSLNGFFTLIFTGIAGVNHRHQSFDFFLCHQLTSFLLIV